jgi:hypothetical protein
MKTPTPSTHEGPLRISKAFRRLTGAHAILSSVLLADLAGFLPPLLIGLLMGSPIWWFLHVIAHLLRISLVFDIGLLLILLCYLIGRFRQHILRKNSDDAWGCVGTLMVLIGVVLLILIIFKSNWMTFPAHIIPNTSIETFSLNLSFTSLGIAFAASLYLLAHLIILWRLQQESEQELRTFSRAHPDGQFWLLIEQAYALYRRSLTRFNPPPITHLKTPPTFYYYQRQTDPNGLSNPEREIYWKAGHLVMNQAYIGPKSRQTEILLPFLARMLYDNNSSDHLVKTLFQLAHEGETHWFCAWLLAVPLVVAQKCEKRWEAMERDHVLDRDRFAYYCGQGKRLRRGLQVQLDALTQDGLPDNAIPTLIERIDHLNSLIGREAVQVKELRESLPIEPPKPERLA